MQIEEEQEMEKKKNLLQQIGDKLDHDQKKRRLKKALEDAKAKAETHEGEDGYEDFDQRLAVIQHKNDENAVYG